MPILEGSNLEHQEICYVQKLNRVFKFGEYLNFNLNALHSLNLYWTDPNFGGLKVQSCVQVSNHQPFNICTASVQLYENSSFPPIFLHYLFPSENYWDFVPHCITYWNLHKISDLPEVRVSFYHFRVRFYSGLKFLIFVEKTLTVQREALYPSRIWWRWICSPVKGWLRWNDQ